MSRRTQPCRLCPGRTRHDDRFCSTCRNLTVGQRMSRSLGRGAAAAVMSRSMTDLGRTFRLSPLQQSFLDQAFITARSNVSISIPRGR